MHLVTLATPDGTLAQRTAVTAGQKKILTALGVDEPSRILEFTTSADNGAPQQKAQPLSREG